MVRKFIDSLPLDSRFKYLSIDSRVHMLMPGWMPCIGGWHCDDFYRPGQVGNHATGGPVQPDLEGIIRDEKYSKHHALVIGDTAPTEFITTPFNLEIPTIKPGENLYKKFDQLIEQELESFIGTYRCRNCHEEETIFTRACNVNGDGLHRSETVTVSNSSIKTTFITPGQIVSFDCFDFHRGTVATASGWRLFMRATESNHWEPQNEIRTQTQVYLESFHAGW